MSYEQLLKKNRNLARQVSQLKQDLKVDIKKFRHDCMIEGYNSAIQQVQPELDQLKDEIKRLKGLLQSHGISY